MTGQTETDGTGMTCVATESFVTSREFANFVGVFAEDIDHVPDLWLDTLTTVGET